jgi:hypothetical protein
MKDLYTAFLDRTHHLAHNLVCASCAIVDHDPTLFHLMSTSNSSLDVLAIPSDIYVPFDFTTGDHAIDSRRVMIEKAGMAVDGELRLCDPCHKSIIAGRKPDASLSNFRWIGDQPEELRDLSWLEELLIARAHLVGRIVRLEERKATSYFSLKGHTILLPQDTTRLLDLLPMPLSALPEIVRVVWASLESPNRNHLRSHFTVRTSKVYNALLWLCRNHEDYRHVTIDEERLATWNATEVAVELLDSMSHVSDPATEDASRSGFATENPDSDEIEGDIPPTVSGMVDVNNTTASPNAITLLRAAQFRERIQPIHPNVTINVVTGSTILNDWSDPTYFTSAFPTLFPYGTGKHLDKRRRSEIPLQLWIQLLLKHASRYLPLI